jgi:hypothetical protein
VVPASQALHRLEELQANSHSSRPGHLGCLGLLAWVCVGGSSQSLLACLGAVPSGQHPLCQVYCLGLVVAVQVTRLRQHPLHLQVTVQAWHLLLLGTLQQEQCLGPSHTASPSWCPLTQQMRRMQTARVQALVQGRPLCHLAPPLPLLPQLPQHPPQQGQPSQHSPSMPLFNLRQHQLVALSHSSSRQLSSQLPPLGQPQHPQQPGPIWEQLLVPLPLLHQLQQVPQQLPTCQGMGRQGLAAVAAAALAQVQQKVLLQRSLTHCLAPTRVQGTPSCSQEGAASMHKPQPLLEQQLLQFLSNLGSLLVQVWGPPLQVVPPVRMEVHPSGVRGGPLGAASDSEPGAPAARKAASLLQGTAGAATQGLRQVQGGGQGVRRAKGLQAQQALALSLLLSTARALLHLAAMRHLVASPSSRSSQVSGPSHPNSQHHSPQFNTPGQGFLTSSRSRVKAKQQVVTPGSVQRRRCTRSGATMSTLHSGTMRYGMCFI